MTPPGANHDTHETAQGPSSSNTERSPRRSDGRTPPATDTAAANDERRIVTDERRIVPTKDEPLPYDEAPPLPEEAPPEDDGWDCMWDANASRWYFLNRFTGMSQWENPRVPETAPISNGSYDRFANYSSPSPMLSYPNPCPSQICRPSICPRNQFWRPRYILAA